MFTGLQTPRLKRLAEIVSAQAIAQQEKIDYEVDEDFDGNGGLKEDEADNEVGVAAKRLSA